MRVMAGVAVSASVALVACGPEEPKDRTGESSGGSATAAAKFAPRVKLHERESLRPVDATQ